MRDMSSRWRQLFDVFLTSTFVTVLPYCPFSHSFSQSSRSWKLLLGYNLLLMLDLIYRCIVLIRMHAFLSRCFSLSYCIISLQFVTRAAPTPSCMRRSNFCTQICCAGALMSTTASRYGEGETEELPMEGLRIFDVLSHAASAYYVVACWITHAHFPMRPCPDLSYQLVCGG